MRACPIESRSRGSVTLVVLENRRYWPTNNGGRNKLECERSHKNNSNHVAENAKQVSPTESACQEKRKQRRRVLRERCDRAENRIVRIDDANRHQHQEPGQWPGYLFQNSLGFIGEEVVESETEHQDENRTPAPPAHRIAKNIAGGEGENGSIGEVGLAAKTRLSGVENHPDWLRHGIHGFPCRPELGLNQSIQ